VVSQQYPANAILVFLGLVVAFVAAGIALRGFRLRSTGGDNATPSRRPDRAAIIAVIGLAIAVLGWFWNPLR
jgi:hypothetical protein